MIYDIGQRQVGYLSQETPKDQKKEPLVTLVEGAGLITGTVLALGAGFILKPGAVKTFLVGVGGSVAGSSVFSVIKRRA